MAVMLRFEVDLDGTATELERLQHPPVDRLEAVLATTFAVTESRVHVITGKLKASGRMDSEFYGDVWEGTLSFDRYPGIFELARGPMHTHGGKGPPPWPPHGGVADSHFFFDDVESDGVPPYDFRTGLAYKLYTHVIEDFLEG